MKVVVIDSAIGNDYSIYLCKHLYKLGAEVTFIVPENRKINIPIKFSIKYWAPTKENSNGKFKKTFKYIKYHLKLIKYILTSKTEIVHYQFFRRERMDSIAFFIQHLFGIRLIYTAHNILPHERNRLDYYFKYLVYKSADTIIIHSSTVKRVLLQSFNISDEKVQIIPHGNMDYHLPQRNISRQEYRERLNLSVADNVILFFGYIREYKGLDLLLDAFSIASASDDKLKLIIVGKPHTEKLKESYIKKIEELPSRDRIYFYFHFIPSEDIATYFVAADIVVLPYRNIYHSGNLDLAYTFGKPIIATKVGDFEETIEHEKSGLLMPGFKAEDLARTINKAFSNEYDLEKMGEYARYLSETKYSWKKIAEQTLNVYHGCKNSGE